MENKSLWELLGVQVDHQGVHKLSVTSFGNVIGTKTSKILKIVSEKKTLGTAVLVRRDIKCDIKNV